MSDIERLELGDLDGTNGWIMTSGFVNWIGDVASHRPYQRVGLGDESTDDGTIVCTVWDGDIEQLEKGSGYYFGGVDDVWEDAEEVQLKLIKNSWVNQFWPPDEE